MKVSFSAGLSSIFILSLFSAAASASSGTTSKTLRISSINIRWYGLGGKMSGSSRDEKRDTYLREFLSKEIPRSDIIAFQEIVDVERLEKNVVPAGWGCISYEHPDQKHQHVVLCHAPQFQFAMDPNDNNYILEDVAYDAARGRPAVHALVQDSKGNTLARIVGVHLKAFPNESRRRIDQTTKLAKDLNNLSKGVPTVVLGDFNTYPSPMNEQKVDDQKLMDEAFKANRAGLKHVANPYKYTWRHGDQASLFDHMWVSQAFKVEGQLEVFRTCNDEVAATRADYNNREFYYEHVSDHCPISATLNLN